MPQWLIKLFHSLGRKLAAKRTGIAQIPTQISAEGHGAGLYTQLREAGFTDEALTKLIKSEKDIIRLVNKVESMQKQTTPKVISQGDPEFQGITEKLLGKKAKVHPFTGFTPRIQQDVDSIIKNLKSMEPVAAMKEANLVIGRKGNYKHLSNDEAQRILKETDDHIFQRDIKYDEFGDPIKPDPEDMASGGRTGYAVGKLVKGGKWFLKSLYDTKKQLMQLDIPLSQKKELMKQADDAIKHIEGGGPIPEQIIQHIRKDPKFKSVTQTRSSDPDLAEMEEVILEYGKKHAEGGRIGMMYGGDPGFAFEYGGSWADWHDQHRDQMPVEQYIKTKLPKHRLPFRELQSGGLAYMLGEPTYMKYYAGGSVGHAPWHKPTAQPQPPAPMDTPTPNVATRPDPLKAPRGLPSLAPKNMDPAYMQQQMMQRAMMGQGPRPMANAGGRIGFDKGKKVDLSKRRFLKGTGAAVGLLSMLPFVGKFFKPAAKALGKFKGTPNLVVDITKTPNMPEWYIPVIKKVLNQGDDVTDTAATASRQRVHRDILPDGDEVTVTQNIDNQTIEVNVANPKDNYLSASGAGETPYTIQYSKGQVIDSGKMKGQKTPDTLEVDEPYVNQVGPDTNDVEIEFDVRDYNPKSEVHDTSVLESYATGKKVKPRGTGEVRDPWEGYSPDLKADDYAKGGLAYLLGE